MRRISFGLPSPAMIVAMIALVTAMTGTAVAAVNFAKNAGAVDGKSAVADGAKLSTAAGRLVATQRGGVAKGTISAKYLDLRGRPVSATFGRAFDVTDNATGVATPIGGIPGLGTLSAQCLDQSAVAGNEDPATTLTFANTSGDAVNLARTVGAANPLVTALTNGTQDTFTIGGSSTFTLQVERKGVNYLAQGVVRQDGRGSAAASCLVYGLAIAAAG